MGEQKTIGQIAYEAASKSDHDPIPWDDPLNKDLGFHVDWEAAASAVWDQAVEACFMVVREGVQWKPEENFSDNWRKAARQTAYHLADALRSLKGETDDAG